MVTRVRRRREWPDKAALLAGGSEVEALPYARASQDKKEQGKSVADQARLNRVEIDRNGWYVEREYVDNDKSASRYARKAREDYPEMLAAIRAGRGDVLVMFETARTGRDLALFVELRDLCVRSGLLYWCVGGSIYDLRNRADRMSLGFLAIQAEDMSEYIRENVKRGIDGAAAVGRPHGQITYGYRRIYDDRTGAFLEQVPDAETRQATGADGTVTEYARAEVIEEIFQKIGRGVPLITIERALNARGIPGPKGGQWRRGVIRKMALNPAYIGKRVLRGEVVGDGVWEGIITPDLFWAVNLRLSAPERKTTRPGRVKWLLSYLAVCGECQGPMSAATSRQGIYNEPMYRCYKKRCSSVKVAELDNIVQATILAFLCRPDVYALLTATAGNDDEQASAARAEANQLRTELENWINEAVTSGVSATTAARIEKGYRDRIAAANDRAAQASTPAALRGLPGPDIVARWSEMDLAAKREVVRLVAPPTVKRALVRDRIPLADRIVWGGLLSAGQTATTD